MFLSQPPTARTPSIRCAFTTASIESAITSRETSEYFMPSVPIEMPSLTVMVPNRCGIAPAWRSAASARAASRSSPRLQGVSVLAPLATPTIGFPKSPSVKPTARSIARFGARAVPSVISRLRSSLAIVGFLLRSGFRETAELGGRPARPVLRVRAEDPDLLGQASQLVQRLARRPPAVAEDVEVERVLPRPPA